MTRFIADGKLFISEWDGRYDWLQTTAEHDVVWCMWAEDHRELFACVHLNTEWLFHVKSHELTGAFLACPPDWAQGPPLLRDERGLLLPGCGTIVSLPVLWLLFSRQSMLQSSMVHGECWVNCSTRVGNFEASTVCWREATRLVQLSRFQMQR